MEEGDLSSENWHVWCRLCGSLGSQQHTNMFDIIEKQERVLVEDEQEISLLEAIHVHLNMTITQYDELPKMICLHCAEVMKNFVMYHKHVHNVQKMFKAIHENESVEWHELDEVRKKFGILNNKSANLCHKIGMLNAEQGNNIVTERTADQLSYVSINELAEDITKEKEIYKQEELSELECIEQDVYSNQSSDDNDYNIWSSDNENAERSFENCTDYVEIPHVQNMEENSARNCQANQTKPDAKSKTLVQKAIKCIEINVTCAHCHEQFDYFKQYREHLIEKHYKHKDSKQWECPKCAKSFTSDYLLHHLKNHILANKGNKKIYMTCNYCDKEFQYYESYRIHLIEKHNKQIESRNWECPKCEKPFMSSNDLEHHLRNHIPSDELNEIPCTHCNKPFLTQKSLKDHIRHTHNLKRYVCEESDITVKTTGIRMHNLFHNIREPFECTVCKKRFKYANKLKTHMETHDDKKHICNICGLQLNTRVTLQGHMKVHDNVKKFKCDLCDKAFRYKISLKEHLDSHTGHKSHICDICGIGFKYRSNIRRHKINMHPEKYAPSENVVFKYECIMCDLKFHTRSTLIHHMKVHGDIKKFKCDLCDKAFKLKASLRLHLVSHAGLKLYTCNICGLGFANNGNCRRHKINIHPEKWATLEKLGDNKKVIHRLPTIETLKELAAINFNNGNGKKQKKKRTNF